jgi:hypothetical protein
VKRLILVLACVPLFGFAPIPIPRNETDPDKAIAQLEKAIQNKEAAVAQARKQKVLESLRRLHAELTKQGRTDRAESVHDRMLLVQTLQNGHLLGSINPDELLTRAAVTGKYKHLKRVLLVPNDRSICNQFADFGFWNGTAYADATDLTPGYWVYVYPRWFLWSEGPPRP